MITLSDVTGLNISQYVEKCIVYSVPTINSLSLNEIREFNFLIIKYHARILSDISLYNLYTSLMMHNFTNMQKEAYLVDIIDNIKNIRKTTKETLSIQDIQRISSYMNKTLSELRTKIEDSYLIPRGTLNLYENIPVEAGLSYTDLKNTSSTIFNFYEGRNLYNEVLSLMNDFTKVKGILEDQNSSSKMSFIDKFNFILESIVNEIKEKLILDDSLEKLDDSCVIATKTCEFYELSSKSSIDLFLNREYSKIREDILNALRNTL